MRHVFAPDQARWGGRMRRPGRRAAGVMAAAAASLILVTGCSSSPAAGPTASGTITVAAAPGVADAPLYIGLREGLFSKVGLTVHVVPASSVPQEVAALRNHTADIAFGDYANMFYAEEQSPAPHLLAVADGYDAGPNVVEVLTLPNSNIVRPKDLENKVIGTDSAQAIPTLNSQHQPQPYGIDTVATWSVLASDNVRVRSNNVRVKTITWEPMAASKLIGALQDGQVNAILATEPTIYAAESELGAVPVVDACTGATANLPLDGYFTTSSYATKNPQVVAAFRGALAKAQAQAAMAAPLQTALTKSAGMKPQAAAMVTLGTYPTTTSAQNLQRVVQLMYNFGTLPKNFEVQSIVVKANGS